MLRRPNGEVVPATTTGEKKKKDQQSALIRKKSCWLEGFLLSPLPGADFCLENPVISINIAND